MNIWIFNQYAITPDLPGGTRHYDLGRELVQRGHKVTIFATSFHHYLHRETRLQPGEWWKTEDKGGLRCIWPRTPPYCCNDWQRALLKKYNWEQEKAKLLRVYEELVEKR